MASDEPACDHHHSSEEEEVEAPSAGSPTDSWQGESVSSREERKAHRDNLKEANKQSLNDKVENKEKTKQKAKSKKDKAETLKEGLPPPVLSVSHGSMVIDCLEDGMVPLYRELDGQFVQAGWAPLSKKKPVLLAKNKNPVLSGPPPPLKSSNKRSFQDSNQFPSRSSLRDEISEHAEDQHYLARLYDGDSDAEDRDSDSGSEREEPRSATLPLRGWVWKELWSTACVVRSRLMLSPRLRHRYGSPPGSMTSTKSRNAMSTFLRERSTSRHYSPCMARRKPSRHHLCPMSFVAKTSEPKTN